MRNFKERLCCVCGDFFGPTSAKAKSCDSKECKQEMRRRADRALYDKKVKKSIKCRCFICEEEFTTSDSRRKYCGGCSSSRGKKISRCKKTLVESGVGVKEEGTFHDITIGRDPLEKELIDFVVSLVGVDSVVLDDTETVPGFELYLHVPSKKVVVEFCSFVKHSEIRGATPRPYHYNKMIACNEKGIRVLHIFEDELRDRKSVVLSRVQNAIGVGLRRVFARKCEIVELTTREAADFLTTYHLQGKTSSVKRWGLVYEGVLVSVLTAGHPARAHTSGGFKVLEIKRFASKEGYSVVGGASKLFKCAKKYAKEEGFEKIKSYCDMRYGAMSPVYEQLGLTLQAYTKWTPHYVSPNFEKRVRNQGLRKTPEERLTGLSEWELRKSEGYDRLYDCGHRTYIMDVG